MEEIEQMTSLFQQKQRELLVAASRVEELSDQLEALRSSRMEPLPHPPSHYPQHVATVELECLYKELQVGRRLLREVKLARFLASSTGSFKPA